MKLAPRINLPIANFHVDDFILLSLSESRLINSRELFKGLDCFALKFFNCSAVVVARLVESLLPTAVVHSLNPTSIIIEQVATNCNLEKEIEA